MILLIRNIIRIVSENELNPLHSLIFFFNCLTVLQNSKYNKFSLYSKEEKLDLNVLDYFKITLSSLARHRSRKSYNITINLRCYKLKFKNTD